MTGIRQPSHHFDRWTLLTARRRFLAGERDGLARDLGLSLSALYKLAQRQGWPRGRVNRRVLP